MTVKGDGNLWCALVLSIVLAISCASAPVASGSENPADTVYTNGFVYTADSHHSVFQALAVIETLVRVLVLTVRIKNLIETQEKSTCGSVSMSEANSS